jgi:oxygen-independent coproporphyrinogen III oxidase
MPKALQNSPSPRGLYLHVPFCHARCGYCDFVTFTGKESQIARYVDGLCREIALYAERLGPQEKAFQSVFFGGGTPSLLEPSQLQQILSTIDRHFEVSANVEVTLEANPESVTPEKAQAWKASGVNRVSLGLQAFDDSLLKSMGRLHSADEFLAAYGHVRHVGFSNVNIDLIYGFHDQSFASWQETVDRTLALSPEHLSMYALTIEEHTPFGAAGVKVDSDRQAQMYAWARERTTCAGLKQYEVSNFARNGRACEHNLIYWRRQDYLGLGVGAVGCIGNTRWTNHKTLPTYFAAVENGRLPRAEEERLDDRACRFETLMLGLRLREGFSWDESDPDWLEKRTSLKVRGLLEEIEPGVWRIPDEAIALTKSGASAFCRLAGRMSPSVRFHCRRGRTEE